MDQSASERDIASLWADYHHERDLRTRNRLVERYWPLVTYVAGRVAASLPASVDRGDLTSEGTIGLMDAITKYEADRGIRFESYAVRRIRGAMVDSLRAADWAPRSVRTLQRDTEHVVQAQVSVGHLFELERMAPWDDTPCGGGTDPTADDDVRALLATLISDLPERDAVVISLYYFEELSFVEVGQVLSVTESRVSQLHSRATRTLRAKFDDQASA